MLSYTEANLFQPSIPSHPDVHLRSWMSQHCRPLPVRAALHESLAITPTADLPQWLAIAHTHAYCWDNPTHTFIFFAKQQKILYTCIEMWPDKAKCYRLAQQKPRYNLGEINKARSKKIADYTKVLTWSSP